MHPVAQAAERGWRLFEEAESTPVGSWRMVVALPCGPLAGLVEGVWACTGSDLFEEETILPRTRTEVLFGLGERHWLRDPENPQRDRHFERSFLSGLQDGPLRVESPGTSSMAGIRLRAAGVAAFLRDTPAVVTGAVVELEDVLGPDVEELREQVASTPDLRVRVLLLAAAVARRLEGASRVSAPVSHVLAALHRTRGGIPIGDLVRATGFSHRWLTERFRTEVGMTPKVYARVVRFEAAFEELGRLDRVHWADFALGAGYYDQAHLVREFRRLAGASPTEVFRRRAPEGLGLLTEEEAALLRPVRPEAGPRIASSR